MDRLEKIIAIIKEVGVMSIPEDMEINSDTDIVGELSFDSIDMVMVVGDIEETFGISIENDMIQEIRTVNDINNLIGRLLGE